MSDCELFYVQNGNALYELQLSLKIKYIFAEIAVSHWPEEFVWLGVMQSIERDCRNETWTTHENDTKEKETTRGSARFEKATEPFYSLLFKLAAILWDYMNKKPISRIISLFIARRFFRIIKIVFFINKTLKKQPDYNLDFNE